MIRRVVGSVAALAAVLLVTRLPALAVLSDEIVCEAQKVKTVGKMVKSEVMKCLKVEAQLNENPSACIEEVKSKMDKKVIATESKFGNCGSNIDSPRAQALIDLYARKIADAAASNYETVPCGCVDKWAFEAGAGEVVRAVADVTDNDRSADLSLSVLCNGPSADTMTADDEEPCTYQPENGGGCPDGWFSSSEAQSCTLTIGVADPNSCQDTTIPYRLRLNTSSHTPLTLVRSVNDDCP